MKLTKISLENFRNYGELSVEFDPGVNLLVGDNAQGKTNLLEAIYLCALGKTFRGAKDAELVRFGKEECSIVQHFLEQIIGHKMRAGTGCQIAAVPHQLHAAQINLPVTLDSILDRIRDIEQKIENGVMAAPVIMPAQSSETSVKPKERPKLDRALPEEVVQIVANWQKIVSRALQPMKSHLAKANTTLAKDDKIMIVLEDGPAYDYFAMHPEHKQQLEYLIGDVTGKETTVVIESIRNKEDFDYTYVNLSDIINMEIEIE